VAEGEAHHRLLWSAAIHRRFSLVAEQPFSLYFDRIRWGFAIKREFDVTG
jgi:hypothetical protein